MLKKLRNAFISGLLILTPIIVTVLVIDFVVDKIGAPTQNFFFPSLLKDLDEYRWVSWILKLISAFIVVMLITILGWFSKFLIGKMVVQGMERFFARVPFVKNVYTTVKQIVDTFSQQKKAVFQKVVLIEFPRKDCWAMGFLTGSGKGEVQHKTARKICNIFLPTTPNPTSGYLMMVPQEDVREMDMSVAEGMKFIISGGAVIPEYNPQTGRTELIELHNPKAATGEKE